MSLKPDDNRKERRKSIENEEVNIVFQQKLNMEEEIKKFVKLKINHALKKIEDNITDQLIAKLLDDIDRLSSEMVKKIGK